MNFRPFTGDEVTGLSLSVDSMFNIDQYCSIIFHIQSFYDLLGIILKLMTYDFPSISCVKPTDVACKGPGKGKLGL